MLNATHTCTTSPALSLANRRILSYPYVKYKSRGEDVKVNSLFREYAR